MAGSILSVSLLCAAFTTAVVLVDFQVAQPPPLPADAKQCTIELFRHTFGNSFGMPEIAAYTPPTDCGVVGSWAGISLNWTATSNGTQFDRLSTVTFQNVEIWRTSTPEPTRGDGIVWTYLKDVSRYIPLFSKPGDFIVDLGNILDSSLGLDGQYDVRLSARFFESSSNNPAAKQPDLILPLSNLSPNMSNVGSVPPGFSINVTFPTNVLQAYAELYASGNGNEEFWYFNTANDFVDDFPPNSTIGNGPFREVRLLVDGKLAGVAFPYAVFFTGAITPNAWRPITSYGALDLPTYFVDLTPFVPIFADGLPHNLTLDVISAEEDHAINQNWFLSGNIQVLTSGTNQTTTGNITVYQADPFPLSTITGNVDNSTGDIFINVSATRHIRIESDIVSGEDTRHVVWTQSLEYLNVQKILNETNVQIVQQTSSGLSKSELDGVATVTDQFSYPLEIDFVVPDGVNITSTFNHSYVRTLLPNPLITESTINNLQIAVGTLFTLPSGTRIGNGTNDNDFSYSDAAGNTFDRKVNAALNNITLDEQSGSLAPSTTARFPSFPKTFQPNWAARLPDGRQVERPNPA